MHPTSEQDIYTNRRNIPVLSELATQKEGPKYGLVIIGAGAPTIKPPSSEEKPIAASQRRTLELLLKRLEANSTNWSLAYHLRKFGMEKKIIKPQAVGGWGLSTFMETFAAEIGAPCIQVGKLMRLLGANAGFPREDQLPEFLEYVRKHPEMDLQLDKMVWDFFMEAERAKACIVVDTKIWQFVAPMIHRLREMNPTVTFPSRINYLRIIMEIDHEVGNFRVWDRQRKKDEKNNIPSTLTIEQAEEQRLSIWYKNFKRYFPLFGFPLTHDAVLPLADFRVVTKQSPDVLASSMLRVLSAEYNPHLVDTLEVMAKNSTGIHKKLLRKS